MAADEAAFQETLRLVIEQTGIPEQAQQLVQLEEQYRAMEIRMRENRRNLSLMVMAVRDVNALRLAVTQTSRAIRDLNPAAAMYAFLNVIQVIRNTMSLLDMLRKKQQTAIFAQALLNALSGPAGWAVIAGSIFVAGAIAASVEGTMHRGGLVGRTGLYYMKKGELVIPTQHTSNFGPFTMIVNQMPTDPESAMRAWAINRGNEMRRGGYAL